MNMIEISPELLAELKEKAEKAIPGEWRYSENNEIGYDMIDHKGDFVIFSGRDSEEFVDYGCLHENYARFISSANPQIILALIAKIEQLEKMVDWIISARKCRTRLQLMSVYCSMKANRCSDEDCTNHWRKEAQKAVER